MRKARRGERARVKSLSPLAVGLSPYLSILPYTKPLATSPFNYLPKVLFDKFYIKEKGNAGGRYFTLSRKKSCEKGDKM